MGNEFQRHPREAVHDSTTFGLSRSHLGTSAAILLLNSHNVNFKDIAGGDDKVRNRTDFTAGAGGPVGLEVVGLNGRDTRDEIGT